MSGDGKAGVGHGEPPASTMGKVGAERGLKTLGQGGYPVYSQKSPKQRPKSQ